MKKKRFLWKLFRSYLYIILFSLIAIGLYISKSFNTFYQEKTADDLKVRAFFVKELMINHYTLDQKAELDKLSKDLGKLTGTRITIILPSGEVIADSEKDPAKMESHINRPEIIKALARQTGISTRYSYSIGEDLMYVAIPVYSQDKITAVIRTSIPITFIRQTLEEIHIKILLTGLIIAAIAVIMSLIISRRITNPLEFIKKGAERFARGDLKHKLPYSDSLEIGSLAESMNQMAAQIDEKLGTIVRQRNELELVLKSMVEGVLAVDTEERIISLNQSAAKFFDIDPVIAPGKNIQETIRNTDLQKFIQKILNKKETMEKEIEIYEGNEKHILQARGTTLHNVEQESIGAVIVLNDITHLRKLENIRRDFVANVSHEIRTPITSIKGFVETLLDGAIDNKEEAIRFLDIIEKHADRLNSIIDDLLSLSRIEQETDLNEITKEECVIKDVLLSAVQACMIRADSAGIKLEIKCNDDIKAKINATLIEQSVTNLIDNAIKYSDPETVVNIEALENESEVVISVRDQGAGIEEKHLDRIFERFYRVDKARSRKLGGTGLGLAIVKHIAQVHGGYANVKSTYGKGSTFFIHLPINK